jgi:acetyltransferase-like isoleucine patch superfamily enzyme
VNFKANVERKIMTSTFPQIQIESTADLDASVKFGPNCREIYIGHGVRLRRDIYIDVEKLHIGDYTTIQHGSIIHGKNISLGNNCWVGHYSVLDGLGGELIIGNNVGVGAHSQLWSHMKFGDMLAGCKWKNEGRLVIGDDAWLVGHCIVNPIIVEPRAMLLTGGVATRDMKENHTYAGTPAVDVTDALGGQFQARDPIDIERDWNSLINDYARLGNDISFIRTVKEIFDEGHSETVTTYSPIQRLYIPNYSEEETAFMRFLLYDKAKFLPIEGCKP